MASVVADEQRYAGALRAAETSSLEAATVSAIGFSTRIGIPRCTQASPAGTCSAFGVAMITPSGFSRSSISP